MRYFRLVALWALFAAVVADNKVLIRVKPISSEELRTIVGEEESNISEGRLINNIISGLSGLTAGFQMGKYINSLFGSQDKPTVGGYPLCAINARPEGRESEQYSYSSLEDLTSGSINNAGNVNGQPVINCVLVVDDQATHVSATTMPSVVNTTTVDPMTGPTDQPTPPPPHHPHHHYPPPPWYPHYPGYPGYPDYHKYPGYPDYKIYPGYPGYPYYPYPPPPPPPHYPYHHPYHTTTPVPSEETTTTTTTPATTTTKPTTTYSPPIFQSLHNLFHNKYEEEKSTRHVRPHSRPIPHSRRAQIRKSSIPALVYNYDSSEDNED